MKGTNRVPLVDGYIVQCTSQFVPVVEHPLACRTAFIIRCCHSYLTGESFSPARCIGGFSFSLSK